MVKRLFLISLLILGLSILSWGSIKLVMAVHWSDYQVNGVYDKNGNLVSKGLKQYVDEYMHLNHDVKIEIQSVAFDDYLKKILITHMSGKSADVYLLYSLWGVQLVDSGILNVPPRYISEDVKKNYVESAIKGTTINNVIWGIPIEVDNYALVYNKKLLKEAGYSHPPKTWDELVEMAPKLIKKDNKGAVKQYGFAFLAGWDSAVVHPYLSLLYSCGGKMLAPGYKKCLLNSPEAIKALNEELRVFKNGGTDPSASVWNFAQGTVAMIIMAPWYESSLKIAFGDKFAETVGVAPIPYIDKPANVSYAWFTGVDSTCKHKKQAWKFLSWLCSEIQPNTKTTRLGDLMAETIGAIPPRIIDLKNHPKQLEDVYTRTFIKELKHSIPEPNVVQGAEIKTTLMNEIVKAWHGEQTAKQALEKATKKINEILSEYY